MSAKLPLSSQHHHSNVPVEMPMSYLHLNSGLQKPLLILFHGYSDTAAGFLRRSLGDRFEEYEILAPNGLFPVPVKIEEGWKRTFAWYFADTSKKDVLIHPSVAASAIVHLLEKLELMDRPKILLGFSQGGFFLPYVLPHLKNVKKMFAIGAAYRIEDYPVESNFTLDALHGDSDEVIPIEKARESFDQLKKLNQQGQFFSFAGLRHTMNDEARILLKKKIDEVFT